MASLTKSQQLVYDYLCSTMAERAVPPSVREICAATGLRSTSTVHSHLKSLEALGYITRDAGLNRSIHIVGASAAKQGISLIEGNIHSSDVFYRQPSDAKPTYWEKLRDERGCLCVEMESFALFANAQVLGKNAACLLTISDSFVSPEITTAEQRQKSFTDMMKVALGAEY